jgi:hypothetical protein
MGRLIGDTVLLIAGTFMMIGVAIGVSIILICAVAVVFLKRLKRSSQPALPAGS